MEKLESDKSFGFTAVLGNAGFLMLWLGQITSQMADRVFVYVLMIVAYSLTKSNLGVSLPLLAFGIPSVLVSPWAGVFVDKLDRKWIMVISDLLRGLLILLIIPLISKSVGLIFLVSLLIYSAAQFFAPAETSSIQTILQNKIPRQLRGRVFGVQNMLINSAFTLPVILFGAIADWVGVLIALSALGWMVLLMGVAGIFLPKFKTV